MCIGLVLYGFGHLFDYTRRLNTTNLALLSLLVGRKRKPKQKTVEIFEHTARILAYDFNTTQHNNSHSSLDHTCHFENCRDNFMRLSVCDGFDACDALPWQLVAREVKIQQYSQLSELGVSP